MRLGYVFAVAFVLNFAWEHVHAPLYAAYKSGPITEWILLRATLADALIITVLAAAYLFIPFLHKRLYLIVAALAVVAVCIEWWALATGRWAYGPHMPLIPLLNVGLTPAVQLAVLGYAAFVICLPSAKSKYLPTL